VIIVKPAREQVCDARKRNTRRRQSLTRPVRAERAARAVMIARIKSNQIKSNARVERDIIIIESGNRSICFERSVGRPIDAPFAALAMSP